MVPESVSEGQGRRTSLGSQEPINDGPLTAASRCQPPPSPGVEAHSKSQHGRLIHEVLVEQIQDWVPTKDVEPRVVHCVADSPRIQPDLSLYIRLSALRVECGDRGLARRLLHHERDLARVRRLNPKGLSHGHPLRVRWAGLAVNQIRQCLRVVKLVYGWGRTRKVLTVNELPGYRFMLARGEKVLEPPEFRSEEWALILRALDGQTRRTWKAWISSPGGFAGVRRSTRRTAGGLAAAHLGRLQRDPDGVLLAAEHRRA